MIAKKILLIAFAIFILQNVYALTCPTGYSAVKCNAISSSYPNPAEDCFCRKGSSGPFYVAIDVSHGPNVASRPTFTFDTVFPIDPTNTGVPTPLYLCFYSGFCFRVTPNDISIVSVDAKNIKEGDKAEITTSFYNTNPNAISGLKYKLELFECGDTACNTLTPKAVQLDDGSNGLNISAPAIPSNGSDSTPHIVKIAKVGTPPADFALPSSVPALGYKVVVTIKPESVDISKNTDSTNDSGSARFAVSRGLGDFPIPETSPFLVIAIAGIVSIILFRRQ